MMQRIVDRVERLLKKAGLVSPYDNDDIINADNEDAERTHSSAVDSLHASIQKRLAGNEALRRSIDFAKERTNSFGEFERRIRDRK